MKYGKSPRLGITGKRAFDGSPTKQGRSPKRVKSQSDLHDTEIAGFDIEGEIRKMRHRRDIYERYATLLEQEDELGRRMDEFVKNAAVAFEFEAQIVTNLKAELEATEPLMEILRFADNSNDDADMEM